MDLISTELKKFDLNLLVAFTVLLEERSVTKAAEKLNITQPAMSKILNRLRQSLDDELFENSRQGLLPTPRALELAPAVSKALSLLAASLYEPHFSPEHAAGEIRIQIPDIFSMAVIPSLYTRLQGSPGVRLTLDNNTDNLLELLSAGKTDFAIYADQEFDDEYLTFPLAECPIVCFMREDHPLAEKSDLTMDDVEGFPRVAIIYDSFQAQSLPETSRQSAVQKFITDYHHNESGLKTRQILSAMAALLDTDAVTLAPYVPFSIAKDGIHLIARPIALISEDFKAKMVLIQHRRTQHSGLHNYLRGLILESWDVSPPQP